MVAFASERAFNAERPVLPPLHTLGLLDPPLETARVFHEPIYNNTLCPLRMPQLTTATTSTSRSSSTPPTFSSMSSSTSTLCAPPTPVLSISPLSTRAPSHPNAPPVRFRLEPCALADAQAIVLVPPPGAPFIPNSSMPTPQPPQKRQALLLLGHSLEHFRRPDRQLLKGARVHPYRITKSRREDTRPPPVLPESVMPVTL